MSAPASAARSPRAAAILADEVEALAFTDLYDAAPSALQASLGLDVQREHGATLLLAPAMPSSMFNRVIGIGLDAVADDAAVAALVRTYRDAGARNWWLHWSPYAQPADLPTRLLATGFTQPARRTWAKMLRGPERATPVATSLAIAPVRDDQAAAVAAAIATAFGMPPFMSVWLRALHGRPRWRVYSVTDGETVVGGGCLYVDGTSAWLGMGAVQEAYRRRGGQRALMARRIDDAVAAGARDIVTETGEAIGDEQNPSLANMVRSGFVRVASRLNFAGPVDTAPD